MTSLFYKRKFERPISVSFLLIERIAQLLKDDSTKGERDEAYVSACVIEAVSDTLNQNCTQSQLDHILTRLMELSKKAEEQGPKSETKVKPGFATSYVAWAEGLDPAAVCFVAAGHDFEKAQFLYEQVDRDDVMDLAEHRMKYEWENIKIGFESSAYAFGGGYKDDPAIKKGKTGGQENVVDLTKGGADAARKLKEFHF